MLHDPFQVILIIHESFDIFWKNYCFEKWRCLCKYPFPGFRKYYNHTIQEMLFKEMSEGQSWLRIRNQVPCNDCIYQWLCSSPSDYELDIGKPNLCHVK
jgi:hypothetical protein